MTEAQPILSIGLMGGRDPNPSSQESNGWYRHASISLQDHAYLTPSGAAVVRPDFARVRSLDTRDR